MALYSKAGGEGWVIFGMLIEFYIWGGRIFGGLVYGGRINDILRYITFTWYINQRPIVNIFSFHFSWSFLFINVIIAHQLYHYLSPWLLFLSHLESSENFHHVPEFLAISCCFFGCCDCCLLCIRLHLHYERHW